MILTLIKEQILIPFFGILFGGTQVAGLNVSEIATEITEIIIILLICRFLIIQVIRIHKKEIKKD